MAMYVTKFSHTPETWSRLLANPEDRREVLGPVIESAGGKLHGFWYAFGEADGYGLLELPDDVAAVSILATVAATGASSGVDHAVAAGGRSRPGRSAGVGLPGAGRGPRLITQSTSALAAVISPPVGSCAARTTSCRPRGRASWPPPTPSAAASSATCTTAPSST